MQLKTRLAIRVGVTAVVLVAGARIAATTVTSSSGTASPAGVSLTVDRKPDSGRQGWRRGKRTTTTAPAPAPTTVPATTVPGAPTTRPTTPTTRPTTPTPTSAAPTTPPPTSAAPTTAAPVPTTRPATTVAPTSAAPTTAPVTLPPPVAAPGTFVETFDGNPTSPQAWHPEYWDIQYHSRDIGTWVTPPPVDAHHGPNCSPSPDMHRVTTWEQSTFVCIGHGHTAIDTPGYGEIIMTPNVLLDFSRTAGTVKWANSTLITSNRDWVDVWITPWQDNLALPLYDWLPDLQGEPLNGIHVSMDFGNPVFLINVIRNHQSVTVGRLAWPDSLIQSWREREPFEIRLTRTSLTLSMPLHDASTTVNFADLGWSQGVVQFGHHSYNPTKDGGVANSWGWDNISISPAVPFSMKQITPRILMNTGTLNFPAAKAGSKLRFAGVCAIDLDFGNGFTRVAPQPQEKSYVEHFSSYFVDVPAGATSAKVRFTGQGWYQGFDCAVKDAAIWSR